MTAFFDGSDLRISDPIVCQKYVGALPPGCDLHQPKGGEMSVGFSSNQKIDECWIQCVHESPFIVFVARSDDQVVLHL